MKITNNTYKPYNYNNKHISFEHNLLNRRQSAEVLDCFVSGVSDFMKRRKSHARDFDTNYQVDRLMRFNIVRSNGILTEGALKDSCSKEAVDFMETFFRDYYARKHTNMLPVINSNNLMEMYTTTSRNNVGIRTGLLKLLKNTPVKDTKGNDLVQPEIAQMHLLFDRIDKDKHTKEFISKALAAHIPFESFSEINTLLEIYGAKKLNIFFDNFAQIMTKASAEEKFAAIEQGLTNPEFETETMKAAKESAENYKHLKKENKVFQLMRQAQNLFNQYKYKHTADIEYSPIPVRYDKMQTNYTLNNIQPEYAHINTNGIEHTVAEVEPAEHSINLVSIASNSPKSRKFRVLSDIKNLINNTLKKSVVERQSEDYLLNGTKMRLKLLPDIFASIKQTRKADYKAGKKHPRSSNSDALTLYKQINGKNRKLIRYMLNITDTEGKRIFEVKDIIAAIRTAEAETAKLKALDKNFKAADKKAYYDIIFEETVDKYGKLPPRRRNK